MGGGKRRPSTPLAASPVAKKPGLRSTPLTAEELTDLLTVLTSVISDSVRFCSERELILLPSQSLALSSALRSAALPLCRLLFLPVPPPVSPPPPNPVSWFARFSASVDDDALWLDAFRMSRPTFQLLLRMLAPSLGGTGEGQERALGAGLLRLAHAPPLRAVARRFGLPSPRAACAAFYKVVRAVVERLGQLSELSADACRVLDGFGRLCLPSCSGVLGFARFPFYNASDGKQKSLIVQALVDSEGRFLDISAGWPGLMRPSEILERTTLYEKQSAVINGGSPSTELTENTMPRYFLGGSCCPLLPWLITPYKDSEQSSDFSKLQSFNLAHARGMELVGRAFGSVRARWRMLRMGWREECAEALPYIIVAGCFLHNYLIEHSEPMLEEVEVEEGVREDDGFGEFDGEGDDSGKRLRDALAVHLSMVSKSN